MIELDPKLTKIIALAKDGVGGEKTTAIRIVKKICLEQGLDFDDVMSLTAKVQEFHLRVPYYDTGEEDVIAQVIFKFASSKEYPEIKINHKAHYFFYNCTASQHIETVNAVRIYLRQYRKEKRKIIADLSTAYIYKHNLFTDYAEKKGEISLEEKARLLRQLKLTENMDDVQLRKEVSDGKGSL